MQVRDHYEELHRRGAEVLVVSFSRREAIARYRRHLGLPFPVAADPERAAYRAYGMLKGSFWAVWHPRVVWRYLVLAMRGMPPRWPGKGDDLSQLGGDFVIGPDAVIRFAHVSRSPDDRPAVALLLAALDGLG